MSTVYIPHRSGRNQEKNAAGERAACVGYPAAPPRRGTPFVARRAVNLHGCAPAFRAPFPQIPAFEARCIRPGIVPLPHRIALIRLGRAPRRRRRIDPIGARPLRERNPGGRPHCAPRSSYCGGTPAARSSYWGAPLLRRLRRTLLPRCGPHAEQGTCYRLSGVPQGEYFVREWGPPCIARNRSGARTRRFIREERSSEPSVSGKCFFVPLFLDSPGPAPYLVVSRQKTTR